MIIPDKPELPTPSRTRWQPLRLGVVELFHYDSEEFWFRDGHLLFRGNNGTGKSKVLSLTLPFLFDAQLKSSRIEPDGDSGKKMAWNLLLGRHDRRMGYAWIEFGRIAENGAAEYFTLGCGLLAAAARPQVDSWFFTLDAQRIGQDLWLTSPQRVVLTRERLRDALEGSGQVFDTAQAYRRAVDERLFHLGHARYSALMDTLIQLRQPQLSKKPDEGSLSNALTEALPPMSVDLLTDVADALNQLEEYRRELAEYEALAHAIGQFNERYQLYAATQARRQSRGLRSAQTLFDAASRSLNEGRAALESAQADEALAKSAYDNAEATLSSGRIRLEQLQDDPAMADAKRLEHADRDAQTRKREAEQAQRLSEQTQERFAREHETLQEHSQRCVEAERVLAESRTLTISAGERGGITDSFAGNPLVALGRKDLTALEARSIEAGRNELRNAVATRREQVAVMQRRCDAVEQSEQAWSRQRQVRGERQDEAEDAAERRAEADNQVEQCGDNLLYAWQSHFDSLQQLNLENAAPPLEALTTWLADPQGENPARKALHSAQQVASERHAKLHAVLTLERQALRDEQTALQSERGRLQQGEDTAPPPPPYRTSDIRSGRVGAPLWQLVEFRASVAADHRAGLEAALQAAGLLDAWVTPEGQLQDVGGESLLHDTYWLERTPQPQSLAAWLTASDANNDDHGAVSATTLRRLLEGIACSEQDTGMAEAWVGSDGRFRLGALGGAWNKPVAVHIGYAARAAARVRRLDDIADRLSELDEEFSLLSRRFELHAGQQKQAIAEWATAPADAPLRAAHIEATARAREFHAARTRLEQADQQLSLAAQQLATARCGLENDAIDLKLPDTRTALQLITEILQQFAESIPALHQAFRELRDALAELARQEIRAADAQHEAENAAQAKTERRAAAEEARIRLEILHESVGPQVGELQQRLTEARLSVQAGETLLKNCNVVLIRTAGELARAEQKSQDAQAVLSEKSTARQSAITALQGFAATGLLAVAIPSVDIPDQRTIWTIEPALTLARRTEQHLVNIKDDDDAWTRVQAHVSQDYSELGRALTALSHQAQADMTDYGMTVTVVYQNRPERPDQLTVRLAEEITQRRELLTAGERKVLENHLQAEIAAAVQKLLQDAERQVTAINAELDKRPTSTGVRFRLKWEPLPESADGAPIGLETARKRLLNTSTDLWSAEDRRVVGDMLHQRISIERSRSDTSGDGSLLDQLSRALDYRRWHRFRVQRWQDGQWRALSGPASSGERALGLTVPLFAAVSSYYTQGGYPYAPRLVLLDEAFAGIDDAARAHCMGLIHEFDLDFVITSEREWACYAELPGVSICQLQRRENVDAVHVSRWTWDGHARIKDRDPDRRFQPQSQAMETIDDLGNGE